MSNVTVPAAAIGLPEDTAVLAETGTGLAIVRPAGLKALRPSFLPGDALDAFLKTLDAYANRLDELRAEVRALRATVERLGARHGGD